MEKKEFNRKISGPGAGTAAELKGVTGESLEGQ